ncbi:Ca2+-transporting ATPase [Desulfuromusa kysingii]|uniref:Ca2+-transporting ATPase n=1 Tax=Desulfuromusa kysingii TaxID=37625 RepID=A0A1H3ZQG9_9BACT|nr:cation-translocating P-type ATPase [Desulfuromusa kysingii]SEA25950.1 Ca2+-transporting ATPase [Desulfuromusa kysingii]
MVDGNFKDLYQLQLTEIEEKFETSSAGLSGDRAAARLQEVGGNQLRDERKRSVLQMIYEQYRNPMIVLLLVAALISGVIGEFKDTFVILIIVILNSLIGFIQEYRAEKALAALKQLAAPFATVRREGQILQVPADELVPGDVLFLETGAIIPADVRLNEVHSLKVDESALTGESVAIEKTVECLNHANLPLCERRNMVYRGTMVTYGHGSGYVTATGMNTEMGRIAHLLDTTEKIKTPLQKRLERVGRNLALVTLLICGIVFVAGLLRGEDIVVMFLTAVSLVVAAVPEALPAVVTISLALGARRLVLQNSLIRRLPAVETLGSTTFICTDKTGTLTLNQMNVEQLFDAAYERVESAPFPADDPLLLALALNNDIRIDAEGKPLGDPTEVALYLNVQQLGYDPQRLKQEYPRIGEIPFSSERQAMSTLHRTPSGEVLIFCKGSFEAVSARCQWFDHVAAESCLTTMATDGLRILAFAWNRLKKVPSDLAVLDLETNLHFIGLSGALDPPRKESAAAVRQCREAGITPVMITGDHPLTAIRIAARIGIVSSVDARVISGSELTALSHEQLVDVAGEVRVYARVAPEQKLRIVAALQERGESVAMTGDGVNDAPALKRAEIGIAMGITGTDVAKEAAEMVLLDDNFATIVKAVREGRVVYANLRKFFKYILACNAGEIWTIFLAPFLGLPLPLLPIHILWINLVTDGAPGLALAIEPAEKGIMRQNPIPPDESLFARGIWQQILWIGLLMAASCLVTQKIAIVLGWHWQTMVFTVLCYSQLFNSLALRSERQSLFRQGVTSNRLLLLAVAVSVAVQLGIIYVPALQMLFHTQALGIVELAFCFVMATIVFVAVELEKWLLRHQWIKY